MPSMEFEASEPRKLFFPDADQNDLQTKFFKQNTGRSNLPQVLRLDSSDGSDGERSAKDQHSANELSFLFEDKS